MTNFKPARYYFSPFSIVGQGSVFEMAGDFTSTPFQVIPGERIHVERINLVLVGAGMNGEKFAGESELTNGIVVQVRDTDDTVLQSFSTDLTPIKTDADWGMLAGADNVSRPAVGDDTLPIRWTVSKAGGPLILEAGQKFTILVNDDLSGVTKFRAWLQGTRW